MKISIITVCYNSEATIERTIRSVLNQDYCNVEYIIIDGLSSDRTLEIINKFSHGISKIVSEKDQGIYDAMNKGIDLASGDLIGILNSDDAFADKNILTNIASVFQNNKNVDAVIGDIAFVDDCNKIVRFYSSKRWNPNKFVWGYMPAHPSFYCYRKLFFKYGKYRTDFEIASDYELMIRFFRVNSIKYLYMPIKFVNMRLGGKSTNGVSSMIKINQEILKACKLNSLKTNYLKIYSKYFFKLFEYIKK